MKYHIKKFKLKSRRSPLYFWVYIYDSVDKLRSDAKSFRHDADDFGGCLGVCQPFERLIIGKDGQEKRDEEIGVVRILNTAGSEITSHEVLHAAFWNFRLEHNDEANFGTDCSEHEEDFVHLFSELYRDFISKMYKFKIWKEK